MPYSECIMKSVIRSHYVYARICLYVIILSGLSGCIPSAHHIKSVFTPTPRSFCETPSWYSSNTLYYEGRTQAWAQAVLLTAEAQQVYSRSCTTVPHALPSLLQDPTQQTVYLFVGPDDDMSERTTCYATWVPYACINGEWIAASRVVRCDESYARCLFRNPLQFGGMFCVTFDSDQEPTAFRLCRCCDVIELVLGYELHVAGTKW